MTKNSFSHRIIKLEETESTNYYASKLARDIADMVVVWSEYQTQGRGQGKNKWESAKGLNLTFSVKIYPDFLSAADQFYLSKVISLAVADFLALYVSDIFIKWPNDIYIGNKKVAGILIENSIEGNHLKDSIIGVGVNINQEQFLSDAPNPVSLYQITGKKYELEELIEVFLSVFKYRYKMLIEKDIQIIDENYFSILYKKDQMAIFLADGNQFSGIITNVDTYGQLEITDTSGNKRYYWYKEVEYLL